MSATSSEPPNAQRERLRAKFQNGARTGGRDESGSTDGARGARGKQQEPRIVSVESALDDLERCASLPTVSTPFGLINEPLGGGLISGQMVVLPGATGAGKSSLLGTIAAFVAESKPVIIATYELPVRLFAARMCAQRLDECWLNVMRGRVTREQLGRSLPIQLSFMARPPLDELERAIAVTADRHGTAPAVFLDYLQIIPAARQIDDIRVATGQTSGEVRELSERTKAPILLAAAVSRQANIALKGARSASPSDLVGLARETSSIEYDAAAVLALAVSDETDEHGRRKAVVAIAKNRFGPQAMIDMRFAGRSGAWTEVGAIDDAPEMREGIRDQIRESLRQAKGPLTKDGIIKRGGKRQVKGREQNVRREIDSMTGDGELLEMGGKYHLRETP